MKILPVLLLLLLISSAYASSSADYSIDGNISGTEIPGGITTSADYNSLNAFGGQSISGTANSTDYNIQVGWIYTVTYDDNVSPIIVSVSPNTGITTTLTSYPFSATVTDEGTGIENCTANVYLNSVLSSTQTLSISDPFSGTCSLTVSLSSDLDTVYVIFSATDYAGNTSAGTQTANVQRNDGIPSGGGSTPTTGTVGSHCLIDDNCKVGLVCIEEKCEYPPTKKPDIIDSSKIPPATGNLVTVQLFGIPIGIIVGMILVLIGVGAAILQLRRTTLALVGLGSLLAIGSAIFAIIKPNISFQLPQLTGNLATAQLGGIPAGILIGLLFVIAGAGVAMTDKKRTAALLVGIGIIASIGTAIFAYLKPEINLKLPEITGNLVTVQLFGIPIGIIVGMILVLIGVGAAILQLRRTTLALLILGGALVIITWAIALLGG